MELIRKNRSKEQELKSKNVYIGKLKVKKKEEGILMKGIKDYMNLPYTKLVQEINDESGHYFYGRILELDGCQSTGNTVDELYENLNEAMEGYIEVKLENNIPIPEPEKVSDYSGKFNVRLPKSLHQRLAIEANNEGISLNQLVLYKLAH